VTARIQVSQVTRRSRVSADLRAEEPPGRQTREVRQVLNQALAARRRDDEDGFTLIELMVVVLIIAILIAIAIPTFLGARQRAQDRAAQSDLRNGLTAEKTFYTDAQSYADTTVDNDGNGTPDLKDIESSLDWGGALTVTLSTDTLGVCLQQDSKSG